MVVSILDYEMGNISSVMRALSKNNIECNVISTYNEIIEADKIILPGVGHFGKAMAFLKSNNLDDALQKAVIEEKKAILGICLGMQLMCKISEEGNLKGLGWFDASVTKIHVEDKLKYKIPHIGWNSAVTVKDTKLFDNIHSDSEFYFVHSYYIKNTIQDEVLCETKFETKFVSALTRDNIFGVQFHPEKSHLNGLKLLKNFAVL